MMSQNWARTTISTSPRDRPTCSPGSTSTPRRAPRPASSGPPDHPQRGSERSMPADISRDTFRPHRHYSGVIMQQGRVQVDADWNEQRDIAAHYLRRLAADLIGPRGGTVGAFALAELMDDHNNPVPFDVAIGAGHYYVDGILCENV